MKFCQVGAHFVKQLTDEARRSWICLHTLNALYKSELSYVEMNFLQTLAWIEEWLLHITEVKMFALFMVVFARYMTEDGKKFEL